MESILHSPGVARGAATRDALLDAAESLIADHGFRSPSHRMIASEAGVHVALVNYHFSSKEMLFEAAIERRSSRLAELWQDALNAVRVRPAWTSEDVLEAWWRPFGAMQREAEVPWSNYLCVIARIASAADGETWHQRYFGPIDREFHLALKQSLPSTDDDDVEAGFRYARCLLGEVLLHRCGKTGGTCRPRGFREDDIGRLIGYLGSGLRGLSRGISTAAA
ncbi:MAG: TetR/AcrR family transcriptional regulator [Betaproteobacteria bacterium]